MRHLAIFACLLLSLFVILDGAPPKRIRKEGDLPLKHPQRYRHHHHHRTIPRRFHGRRLHRQIPHYPARNEKHAAYCSIREYHVMCGPERHCDKSCDNMYSPPNCYHDASNPKCYFPRCLCKEGYVRNAAGHCIWEHQCPNRYSEPSKNMTETDGLVMEFVPFVRPRHRARKARHPHRHRRLQYQIEKII